MRSLAVRIEGMERRRRSVGLLHIVVGLFVIAKSAEYYRDLSYRNFLTVAPFLLTGIASLAYGLFRRKIDPAARYNRFLRLAQILAFLILGFAMTSAGRAVDYAALFVFALLCFLLLVSERRLFHPASILFGAQGISIPGFYREHLVPWQALSDVVVREDFLTLFHVREKYLQYQVTQELSPPETASLNAYCKEQIAAAQQQA